MRTCDFKSMFKAAALVSAILFWSAGIGFAQVNLTAGPAGITLADGVGVPMWGYTCGAAVAGSVATCAALNPLSTGGLVGAVAVVNGGSGYTSEPTVGLTAAPSGGVNATAVANIQNGQVVSIAITNPGKGYLTAPAVTFSGGGGAGATATAGLWWSPVVITVSSGQPLTINLTNNLSFTPAGAAIANGIPTSIMIVGQVGGGLGGAPSTTPSPSHANVQGCTTWFIADPNTQPGVPCTSNDSGALPPAQGPRVQSFGTEVAAVATGTVASTALTWAAPRPGTYLLESGTHPSIQVPMGLIGILVVTTAPSGGTAGTAYPATLGDSSTAANPAVAYGGEVPLEFSEIDPVQNTTVNAAVNTAGFSETMVWDGHTGACGNSSSPSYHQCYPPAVNYSPLYYVINGVAFNKTNAVASVFPATAGVTGTPPVPVTIGVTGNLLLRFVNAGLRMHVPSVVGSQTTGFNGAGTATTVNGFTLVAEDGNPLPNLSAPRVQTHVFMAAGKTYDVIVNAPVAGATDLAVYDRELSLSGNSSERDAGMVAYISVNNSTQLPVASGTGVFSGAAANPDAYAGLVACSAAPCAPLVVSDVSRGVIANDINVYGVAVQTQPGKGSVALNANGTFAYTPNVGTTSDTFTYCANGGTLVCATVSLSQTTLTGSPVANNVAYSAAASTFLKIPSPGVLSVDSDPANLPLQVVASSIVPASGATINMDPNGGFTASVPGPGTYTFTYQAQNSQGRVSNTATVTLSFPSPSNLQVRVVDAQAYNNCNGVTSCINGLPQMSDYRWIIEEDKSFWVYPNCTANTSITTAGCPSVVGGTGTNSTIPTFAVNFHTSNMDFVAQGCTGPLSCEGGQTMFDGRPACTSPGMPVGCSSTAGQHINAVCDLGNGACRPDPTGNGFTQVLPSSVHLDPTKRYYISVLPGDAANPFPSNVSAPNCGNGAESTTSQCGHTMSGAPVPPACNIYVTGCNSTSGAAFAPVTVLVLPTPLPTGKLSVMVFEDDFPLNGEQDGGGGSAVLAPQEPGLGGFNIVLWDTYGGLGDVTGQDTYDMFNQPLSNALTGTVDPATGLDACPISQQATADPTQAGITGMIVTCPKYESDGKTLSPLAGQAVIANLMPEKFSVQAYPGADRISRGEEWLQTNTLDGQHPHDSFIRIGEPSYFQEYGPAGYHVAIGFVNPAIVNARHDAVCAGAYGAVGACTGKVTGQVNVQRTSRTPDQRLYPSGSHDALAWTQCWVSLGDPDQEDFMFTKCDANGNFQFTGVPGGNWRLTIGDQWNDQIIDGLSTPANVTAGQTLALGPIGVQQWQSNLYTRTYIDDNKNGIWDPGEIGIPLIYTRISYRDGHNSNGLTTDFNGIANFNETFPLFNWYVVEADSTRYKTTGIHTVYDSGGPADGSSFCGASGARACGTSTDYAALANTFEGIPLPADLSVPGAVYCAKADCTAEAASFAAGTAIPSSATASTGRIDPPWVIGEGWAGNTSQGNWIEFGKAPYAACPPACVTVPNSLYNPGSSGGTTASTTQVGENGGIQGFVLYASTRPFDSAAQMIQQPWEPNVPRVTINLYQTGVAADGVTPTLKMVDTTQTTSWDDWAQGFYPNSSAGSGSGAGQKPYMSCPGQGTNSGTNADLFYFTLFDQPNYLDLYNSQHNGGTLHTLPYNSQFKCYDAMHIWNQVQPAPFDGQYFFPSSLGINPTTGKQVTTVGATNGVTASMPGTNCTVCVANPDSTDKYRFGNPMLPPGQYVVEVIMPAGYEIYKEEDKNLLIGDNYIAPITQQFTGLGGDIFIVPDQASVSALYSTNGDGFNPTNYQDSTTGLSLTEGTLSGVPGFPGFQDPLWPCVGEMRVVPDYLSLFPQAQEVAPFAGATRPLCDRKEITLANQMSVRVHFAIYTSTHIASKFTGVITDDFTSEFDPFAPQFGEKFAPPNMPVSTRDYLGNEISRVYSDHWGIYDGLTFSSWEVNPPNITGYSPTMMVQCMNDPGPITDTNPSSSTYGQLITDPLYNAAYSDFCYEEPYMPGLTTYLDTPVVPTQAFVGAAYNNVDCAYPDSTPAIAEVDGDGIGPYVSAAGHTLTITALGTQVVNNYGYAGPSASVAPFNTTKVNRHYGFGGQCTTPTTGSATCNTLSSVTIGGVSATINSWNDSTISVAVPGTVPACAIQQQAQYGGPGAPGVSQAHCGQLVVTAGNGRQSVDAVTVTIGGKAPVHVPASATIQSYIDKAAPGDLLIVDPTCTTGSGAGATVVSCTTAGANKANATHNEMVIMWKPVRLQGAGAATTIINANSNPAGKLLDPWRRHINCLFGLTLQGVPYGNTTPYDSSGTYSCPDQGWNYFVAQGQTVNPAGVVTSGSVTQIDRLPLEAVIGWDATLNGNLAEQLQEPTLMGAYEGAGITVLGKGVFIPAGENPWTDGSEAGGFPGDALLLQNVPAAIDDEGAPLGPQSAHCSDVPNPFPSNFMCNPSSIDGLGVTNSSQGGGGIFVHGWAHNIQVANNRVYNNAGTLSGGISIGQGEFPIAITIVTQEGAAAGGPTGEFVPDSPPSCQFSTVLGTHLPYCLDLNVNVHNNYIAQNSSLGDELFSGTLSGGGGATFCTGSDYYKFNYNWVCGNLSSGEGGGVTHLGFIYDGDIEHNSILFNQSTNPTIPTNGGGIQVQGTPDTDPVCGGTPDTDCPPGLSDGTGPGLLINANLIQGNSAESGSGGGIRLQQVNGTEVSTFPSHPERWNDVTITNNIIVNNVAGWDGAGISLQDALSVKIVNNTIMHNDTLASSGVITTSIGAPQSSAPAGNCVMTGPTGASTASCPQSAGVTSTPNSSLMIAAMSGLTITCLPGHSGCRSFSNPVLYGDVISQNRSFYIGIGNRGAGNLNQQNLVSLYDAFTSTLAPTQATTGACSAAVSYWDVGVRGDRTVNGHESGFTLNPLASFLSSATGYNASNSAADPSVLASYCNGSRVPPECTLSDGCGGLNGFGVPPGIADAVTPNPVFSLVPSATVDEGNNWINVSWGPLSLTNPAVTGADGNYGAGPLLGNYSLQTTSPALNYIPCNGAGSSATTCIVAATGGLPAMALPTTDFFGNPRPDPGAAKCADAGAVELPGIANPAGGCAGAVAAPTLSSISPTSGERDSVVNVTLFGANLAGATAVTISGTGVTHGTITVNPAGTSLTTTFTISSTATLSARTVTVTTPAGTSNGVTFTVTSSGVLSFTAATNATLSTIFGIRTLTFTIPAPRAPVTSIVTITNTGVGPLEITAATIAQLGSAFSVTPNTCSFTTPLPAGNACTINVRYATPAARPVVPDIGTLTVANSGSAPAGILFPGVLALSGQ